MNNMATDKSNRYPKPLKKGDKIAIVAPAGHVTAEPVEGAKEVLEAQGWEVVIAPHTLGEYGSYSGKSYERYSDLAAALMDPEVRAIICARGGYGAVHLLDELDRLPFQEDPKWLVGFSDISALHALFNKKGIVSLHGPMTRDISRGADDPNNAMLFDMLRGNRPELTFPTSIYDRPGIATAQMLGGNLAVIDALIGTPYNVLIPGTILFIEDVSEPIYKIERILYQLRLSGVLPKLAGLVVGQFTDYNASDNYRTMEEMIHDMVAPYSYPVAMNVPVGHVSFNAPLISGALVTLRVTMGETNSIVYWN